MFLLYYKNYMARLACNSGWCSVESKFQTAKYSYTIYWGFKILSGL